MNWKRIERIESVMNDTKSRQRQIVGSAMIALALAISCCLLLTDYAQSVYYIHGSSLIPILGLLFLLILFLLAISCVLLIRHILDVYHQGHRVCGIPFLLLITTLLQSVMVYHIQNAYAQNKKSMLALLGIRHYDLLRILYYVYIVSVIIYMAYTIRFLRRKGNNETINESTRSFGFRKEKRLHLYLFAALLCFGLVFFAYQNGKHITYEVKVSDYMAVNTGYSDDASTPIVSFSITENESCEEQASSIQDKAVCVLKKAFCYEYVSLSTDDLKLREAGDNWREAQYEREKHTSFTILAKYEKQAAKAYGLEFTNLQKKISEEELDERPQAFKVPLEELTTDQIGYCALLAENNLFYQKGISPLDLELLSVYYVVYPDIEEIDYYLLHKDGTVYKSTMHLINTEIGKKKGYRISVSEHKDESNILKSYENSGVIKVKRISWKEQGEQ